MVHAAAACYADSMHQECSQDRHKNGSGLPDRLLFILSVWAALTTAIICAVVPAGLPLTRSTGSAFDPSTTVVALRSRPPVTVRAALPNPGEGDGAIGGDPAIAAPLSVPIRRETRIARGPAPVTPLVPVLSARASNSVLHARPPPAP